MILAAAIFASSVCCRRAPAPVFQVDDLKQGAHVAVVPLSFCGRDPLTVELPDEYELAHNKRVDFDLFFVTKRGTQRERLVMGIYVGMHPDESHLGVGTAENTSIASLHVTWWSWVESSNGSKTYHREALVRNVFPIQPQTSPSTKKVADLSPDKPPPSPHPPPVPPPPPTPGSCEEGSIIHVFAQGSDKDEVMRITKIAESLRRTR